jgi:hypothetical protein
MEIEPYDIVNYETLKNGKTYIDENYKSRKIAEYIKLTEPDPDDALKYIFEWNVPEDVIVIFDEVHRCKETSTANGKLLLSAKQLVQNKIPVLLLSATVCENITDMKIPFFMFDLIPNTRNFNHYVKTLLDKYPEHKPDKSKFTHKKDYINAKKNQKIMVIYEEIKEFVSRIRIKDLGDQFPSNQVCCQQFVADEADKISEAYEEIAKSMQELKDNPGNHHLAKIQKLKQEIELRKIPIFIEQAKLYLEEGKSVVIFVNYLATLDILVEELDIKCVINGRLSLEEKQKSIDLFQSNEKHIIVCQINSGGFGISLHDLTGERPRVSLINFPDSATTLLQALGRIHRSGSKSPALQRIIFVANVDYEKHIMRNISRKLANISAINDGDLSGYKYKVKKITRKVIEKNVEQ